MLTQPILLREDHHVVPLVNTHYLRRFVNSNANPADPPLELPFLIEDHHVVPLVNRYTLLKVYKQ